MAFTPLLCQSHYSPLGVCAPAELVRRARTLGYAALGLCDEGTMAGFHEFGEACRAKNVRPVFGVRLFLPGLAVRDGRFPINFLIETEQGYRNLVSLLTEYHRKAPGAKTALQRKIRLQGRVGGLLAVIPPDGELMQLIERKDRERTEFFLDECLKTFDVNFRLGLGVPKAKAGRIPADAMVRRLSEFVRVPAMIAPVVYYAEPTDEAPFTMLKQPDGPPGRGWKIADDTTALPAISPESAIVERFEEGDEAVHESGEIARRCKWQPGARRRIIPSQDFERGFDPNSYLFDLVIRGATDRYGAIDEALKQRINVEFEEIKTRDLGTYLLLFHQISDFLDTKGVSRGVGRGSIISSVLAYCLGITRIDPLQYRLATVPLAEEGETFPPMRVEIPASAAPVLIDWLRATFGEAHLAQIGRRLEDGKNQVLDEIAAWNGMTPEERKTAQRERNRARSASTRYLQAAAESRKSRRWRDPGLVSDMTLRLAPRPRELSAAPGRWTLCGEPLEYVIPVVETDGGERVTDVHEEALDRLGGPRLEFVPHHLLNLLDHARISASETGADFALSKIPMDDRAAWELLVRGQTEGIPPLQGITTKCLLRREAPANMLQLLKVKTEANRGRTAEREPSLIDELPDVLLSYQCAWFRANHPVAYFAGALSSAREGGAEAALLVHAARRQGIEILRPDINLSHFHCTVHGGKIRLGLKMVRHLGARAWEEIARVRQGGRFHSLREFCEGVSPRIVNHRLLQNLIAAGAFDDLGQTRATMAEMVSALQRRARAVSREDSEKQYTLFDMSALETEPAPEEEFDETEAEEWDEATRLAREREALGFNIASDPVARFRTVHESIQPIAPHHIGRRMAGRIVRVAGMIDHVDSEGPLLNVPGARLVDVEGLPVAIGARLAPLVAPILQPGAEVLTIGELTVADGFLKLEAHGIWRLEDLERQAKRVATIRLDLAGENKATLKLIVALAQSFPGRTQLEAANYTGSRGLVWRALNKRRVFFCSPLYQGLCKILSPERVQLIDHDDQPLVIALSGASEETPAKRRGESGAAEAESEALEKEAPNEPDEPRETDDSQDGSDRTGAHPVDEDAADDSGDTTGVADGAADDSGDASDSASGIDRKDDAPENPDKDRATLKLSPQSTDKTAEPEAEKASGADSKSPNSPSARQPALEHLSGKS